MYLKINNIFKNNNGVVDYKGLNIDKFVGGTQYYNFVESYCILETIEQIDGERIDVIMLKQEEYEALVQKFKMDKEQAEKAKNNKEEIQEETILKLMTKVAQLEKQVGGAK